MKTEQQNLIDKATIRYIGETVRKLWGSQMVKHYRLFLGGVPFSWYCGLGWTRKPTKADILGALGQDWQAYDDCGGNLDSFLCEFGYNENTETLKAGKQTFALVERNISQLENLGFCLDDLKPYIQD